MANPNHVEILKKGAATWNAWRNKNQTTNPDLSGIELDRENLGGYNLVGVNFSGAKLLNMNWPESIIGANMCKASMPGAVLDGRKIIGVNFQGAQLTGANFKKSDLTNVDFRGANLTEAILEETNVFKVKYDRKTTFRGIRLTGCYGSPAFKRFAEDQEFIEELRTNSPWTYRIWWLFADCGRSITRWASWSFLFALLFAILFFLMGPNSFEVDNLDWRLDTMIYYSFVTFTTLGFGDITPKTHSAAWAVTFEVIIGYIMLGGLISIFATKLSRRS